MKQQGRTACYVFVAMAGFGGLLWRTGSAGRSTCSLPGALGKRFVPTLYAQCQQSHHNVSVGIVLLAVGVVGSVLTFAPARADLRRLRARARGMPAPAGWMRVPAGWRPTNGLIMPVPPGWPQPPAGWVAPPDWVPPAEWPDPPKGWPRPESRSPGQLRLWATATRAVYVIGFAAVALEIAEPLPQHGVGALILLWPVVVVFSCLVNLVLSFRHLRVWVQYDLALFVGLWACLYATITDVGHARLSALFLAVIEFALAVPLRTLRPAKATRLPKTLRVQPPTTPPAHDAPIAQAPDG